MQILSTNVYIGPNIYASFPVIRHVIDLGVLEEWPSAVTRQILSELVQQHDLAVLVIGHDLNIALSYYHQSLLLKNGQMLDFDQTEKVLTPEHIYTAFQVEADIIHRPQNNKKVIVLA